MRKTKSLAQFFLKKRNQKESGESYQSQLMSPIITTRKVISKSAAM